jgi:hypothetical protein
MNKKEHDATKIALYLTADSSTFYVCSAPNGVRFTFGDHASTRGVSIDHRVA